VLDNTDVFFKLAQAANGIVLPEGLAAAPSASRKK